MFFHFLSFSFIFFVFVGCSKSDFFLGLNFVTISLDNSSVKNHFFGPISGGRYLVVPPLGPLFLFFLLFLSPVFLSFFLLLIFSFFVLFCSFLHLLFSFFRRKKFLLFFFLVSLSKYVLLLALVSEFNCFLRSRCSVEMWVLTT